ncbi:MAG: DNA-binding response regulator [Bacteroidota bacterium]|jgi:DNA-binding NarL/FixJ family response regulator
MSLINVVVANSNYLAGTALKHLIEQLPDFKLIAWVEHQEMLFEKLKLNEVDLLVIDFTSEGFNTGSIQWAKRNFQKMKVLSIAPTLQKDIVLSSFKAGAQSYILNDCGKDEIVEALYKTAEGQDFLCGKVLHELQVGSCANIAPVNVSCEGINLTDRELDIVKLIAEGNSNKQIADILCLSTHTINTHRKNIMNKLGVNNTAGLVMYAVKENLLGPNKFLFSSLN